MSFYPNLASTASRLLKKFGSNRTFSRTVEGEYDPNTGSVAQTSQTFTAYAAVFKYKNQDIDNVNILMTDMKMLVETGSYVPQVNDTVTVFDEEFLMVSASPLSPADTTVIYECHLRQGPA